MRRRRIVIALFLLAVVSGAVLFFCLRPHKEPLWQGKTCSEWFAEFRRAKARHRQASMPVYQILAPTKPGGPQRFVIGTNYFDDTEGLSYDPAADGIRALGTNIIPILTAQIRRGDPKWLPIYVKLFSKLPATIQHIVPKPPTSRDEVRGDAALALSLLRSDAAPAWPTIFEAYVTAAPFARYRFEESLRKIPVEPVVLDATLDSIVRRGDLSLAVSMISKFGASGPNSIRILTNAVLSTNLPAGEAALSQLRNHRWFAPFVVPALRTALTNSSPTVCISIVNVLESYESDASEALPELVYTLRSDDRELRYYAARTIENLGTNALPAVPALLAARSDPNEMVQRVVTRTLNKLNSNYW
jgi:FOG: HEAT repeat